jgi:hypothetical protein
MHVVWTNGYFTLTDNPNYPDAKVRIVPRWATASEMGISQMSRTVVISHFDSDVAEPVRSYMVLRAWMIHRAQQRGWCDAKSCRKRWFQSEVEQLRKDVVNLAVEGGGTGSVLADELIHQWVPSLLVLG